METKFLLVKSLQESLVLRVMDFNDHRADTHLGSASFGLDVLEHDATQEEISRPILKDGHERGQLQFDVNFYPVISPSKTSEGTVQKLPETSGFRYVSYWASLTFSHRRRYCAIGPSPSQRPRQEQVYVRRSQPVRQGLPGRPLHSNPHFHPPQAHERPRMGVCHGILMH